MSLPLLPWCGVRADRRSPMRIDSGGVEPFDFRCRRRPTTNFTRPRTRGSNPVPSSRESATNLAFAATAHQNLPRPDGRRLRRLADLHHAIYATCISWPTEAPRPGRAKAGRLKVPLDRAIRGPEACRQSPLALTLVAASAHERRDAPARSLLARPTYCSTSISMATTGPESAPATKPDGPASLPVWSNTSDISTPRPYCWAGSRRRSKKRDSRPSFALILPRRVSDGGCGGDTTSTPRPSPSRSGPLRVGLPRGGRLGLMGGGGQL